MATVLTPQDKGKLIDRAFDWLFAQKIETILLLLILIFLGYGVTTLVPQHLAQIQNGYDRHAAQTAEAMRELATAVKEIARANDETRQMFIRALVVQRDGGDVGVVLSGR